MWLFQICWSFAVFGVLWARSFHFPSSDLISHSYILQGWILKTVLTLAFSCSFTTYWACYCRLVVKIQAICSFDVVCGTVTGFTILGSPFQDVKKLLWWSRIILRIPRALPSHQDGSWTLGSRRCWLHRRPCRSWVPGFWSISVGSALRSRRPKWKTTIDTVSTQRHHDIASILAALIDQTFQGPATDLKWWDISMSLDWA